MNFRATQLFMMVAMVCYLLSCMIEGDVVFQRTHLPLLVCVALNTVFIFNSPYLSSAVSYELWLVFDVLQIFVVTKFLSRTETMESLLKKYIYCFTAIALLGILQKGLMLVGVDFFVEQEGRVNGFTFEPSYYSTYLLMGWVMCMYLVENRNTRVMSTKKLVICLVLISIANVFSDSRMGILMMAVYILWRIVWLFFSGNYKNNRLKRVITVGGSVVIVGGVGYLGWGIATMNETVLYLFRGLGVAGGSDHSSGARINSFLDTIQAFLNSPIIGYSLGGTDAAVAALRGVENFTSADMGSYSMSILIEAFAAWGVVGGVCLLVWLYRLCRTDYKTHFAHQSKERKELARCVIYALIFELIILSLNQNILRPPLWCHLSVLCALYGICQQEGRRTTALKGA